MNLKEGDLVLILPPEEVGLDRHSRIKYGPYWNDETVTEDNMWTFNSVNMDFYVGKIGRIDKLSIYEHTSTAHIVLHEIYGQRGKGWTFNSLHLKRLDDEPTEG